MKKALVVERPAPFSVPIIFQLHQRCFYYHREEKLFLSFLISMRYKIKLNTPSKETKIQTRGIGQISARDPNET